MWDFLLVSALKPTTPNQAITWYVNMLGIFNHISPNMYVKKILCMFLAGNYRVMPRK
jgi:hypothetical protein